MFASFKRSLASTSGNGSGSDSTGTEKDTSADYADLEKRADGRWSVQNRAGTLKVVVHMDTDGKATSERATCSGLPPAKVGVLSFTLFTLLISGVLLGVTGMNIAQNGEPSWSARAGDSADTNSAGGSMRHVDFLVAATSLSLWAFLFVTCMLGLAGCPCCLPSQPWLESDTILQALCDMERSSNAVHCFLACISLPLGSQPCLDDNLPRRCL